MVVYIHTVKTLEFSSTLSWSSHCCACDTSTNASNLNQGLNVHVVEKLLPLICHVRVFLQKAYDIGYTWHCYHNHATTKLLQRQMCGIQETPRLTTNANLKENLNYTSIQIVRILYIFDVAITNTTCSHATKMTSNRKIMLTSYRNQEATGKSATHVMECNKLQNLRN